MSPVNTRSKKGSGTKINLDTPKELQEWSKKFGISPYQLKIAVIEVGAMSDDVEEFINKQAKSYRIAS